MSSGKLSRNQKAMLFAQGIVERYRARGNRLPHRSKSCRLDPSRAQEYKDAAKLNDWKQSLKGNRGSCSDEVRDYLDRHIPNWRDAVRNNRSESDEENEGTPMPKKRKRPAGDGENNTDGESDEEIAQQILRDSQLLLQLNCWPLYVGVESQ